MNDIEDRIDVLDTFIQSGYKATIGSLKTTKDESAALVAEYGFSGQRSIRLPHVARISDMMDRDHFYPGSQLTLVKKEGRNKKTSITLVDGQHRVLAHSTSESGQDVMLWSILILEGMEKEEVYGYLDVATKPRSSVNQRDAMFPDLPRFCMSAAQYALTYKVPSNRYVYPGRMNRPSTIDEEVYVEEHRGLFEQAGSIVDNASVLHSTERNKLLSGRGLAIFVETLSLEGGVDFWTEICNTPTPTTKSATSAVRRIMNIRGKMFEKPKNGLKNYPATWISRVLGTAWNMRNQAGKTFYVEPKDKVIVDGTHLVVTH